MLSALLVDFGPFEEAIERCLDARAAILRRGELWHHDWVLCGELSARVSRAARGLP